MQAAEMDIRSKLKMREEEIGSLKYEIEHIAQVN